MKNHNSSSRIKVLVSSFLLLCLASHALRAETITWVNPAGGDWNDASNWNPTTVPGPLDTATLSISLSGQLIVPDNRVLNWNNGTIAVGAGLVIASNAVVNWGNGQIDGAITVNSGGLLNITNAASYYFYGTLTNNGVVNWSAGTIGGFEGAVIYNAGLWDNQFDGSMSAYTGTPLFINVGTFRKSGGTLTTQIEWAFTTPGVIDQQTGSLNINWSGNNTLRQNFVGSISLNNNATLVVASNATLNWNNGTISSNSSITLASGSILNWNNGTIAVGAGLVIASNAVVNWGNGQIDGAITVNSGGLLNITNAASYYFHGTLTNNGVVNWSAGTIGGFEGAVIYNAGLWDNQFDGSMSAYTGTPLFINVGTFRKSGGTLTTQIEWAFTTPGVIDQQTGSLNINWSGNNTLRQNFVGSISLNNNATLVVASNATLNWNNGTISSNSSITLASGSILNWNNGTIAVGAGLVIASNAVVNWGNGQIDGAITVNSGGLLNITNAASYYFHGTLTNNGVVNWSAGTIGGFEGAVIYNAGLWDNQFDGSMSAYTGTPLFINVGTFRKSGGTLTTQIEWAFTTPGVIDQQTGSLNINWSGNNTLRQNFVGSISLNNNATLVVASNATLNWNNGTISSNSSITLASGSILNWNNGTIAVGAGLVIASNAVVNWGNGQIDGAITVNSGGLLNITNAASYYFYGTLTNNGVVNWSAGTIGGFEGAVIYNAGLWDNQFDGSMSAYTGTPLFINVGTFRKSGGTLTTQIEWAFSNSGTVHLQTGMLYLQKPFIQSAGVTLLEGNNLFASQGFDLQGGELAGTSSLSCGFGFSFTNSGGTISPGLSPGQLSDTSEFIQLTNGKLNIELAGNIAGTSFDRFVVNGPATLAGTLNVTLTNGFYPETNATFTFLTASSLTGVFSSFNYPSNDVGMVISYTGTNATIQVVNVHPVLPEIADQVVNELTAVNVNAAAMDADGPAQTLTYELTNSPSGASVNSSGLITWTPTEANGPSVTNITVLVTDNGTPNLTASATFQVTVNEVNEAPVITGPGNQTVNEQTLLSINATATDLDIPANPLAFALVSGPSGLTVSSNGLLSWNPDEAQGPGTYTIFISVSDTNSAAVNAQSMSATNSFQITVNEINRAPTISVPATQIIDESTTLTVNATATDPDLPANSLSFALVSGPSELNVAGNGAITWTTTEANGPSTNLVTVRVTDNGSPNLSATNTFTVIVNEVNAAPILPLPNNVTINEGATLTVTNTATDSDIPANTLIYSLLIKPASASISENGIITWITTEADGPTTNTFQTRVVDNGSPNLSATNTFTVIVNEVNAAPILPLPNDVTINETATLTVTNTATDTDSPANTLTYSLLIRPTGAAISSNGVITWITTEADGPTTNTFQTRVVDNGLPSLSATNTFVVIVDEVNVAPVVGTLVNRTVNPGQIITFTANATDADVPANNLSFSLVTPPTGASVSSGGVFNWRPTIAQADTTNTVRIKVTDDGTPNLSNTNSFSVTVNALSPVVLTPNAFTNGQFSLRVSGSSGPDYIVMSSTNLTQWNDIFTNLSPSTPFQFTNISTVTNRFYRVRLAP